ncbi:MAG: peptide-methionine (S)-S-oxide reductase MsrA [Myxococcales bacterium]|nr:peptide-methionine (S)-S-oxide reductase MsrA [Myxococcales bacterium]
MPLPLRSSALLFAVLSCGSNAADPAARRADPSGGSVAAEGTPRPGERADPPRAGLAVAVFAGGCFWCMEHPFERLDGVGEVLSGYTGGRERAPTYEQVSSGRTSHLEAVRVVYDPERVSYERLLEVFWHNVDPTQDDGQFCDRGAQYRTAIFVATPEERRLAEESKRRVAARLGRRVATEIRAAGDFWVAEAYHQDFYRTNPVRYQSYRSGCGRDARLRELWGDDAGH